MRLSELTSIPIDDFITIVGFEQCASLRYNRYFDAAQVKHKDRIYARNWYSWFMEQDKQISVPYTLISNYNDTHINRFRSSNPHLVWYAVQAELSHPQIIRIPVAFKAGRLQFARRYRGNGQPRKHLLYVNFKEHNDLRRDLIATYQSKPWAHAATYNKATGMLKYFSDLAESTFVLSPPGIAEDCYRTWESLLMGAIPIVRRSFLADLYTDLPVVVVDDLVSLTPEYLKDKLDELNQQHFDESKLTMPYWRSRIGATHG